MGPQHSASGIRGRPDPDKLSAVCQSVRKPSHERALGNSDGESVGMEGIDSQDVRRPLLRLLKVSRFQGSSGTSDVGLRLKPCCEGGIDAEFRRKRNMYGATA